MRKSVLILLGFLMVAGMLILLREPSSSPARSRMRSGVASSPPPADIAPMTVTAHFAYVVRAVDGDTLLVRMGDGRQERVRVIGINAPESVDQKRPMGCYGVEASTRMHELLDGKDIEVTPEPQDDRDVFGRLLRYISFGGIDIGAEMIREGYAESYCYKYPHPRCSQYEALERAAVTANVGMWGHCSRS